MTDSKMHIVPPSSFTIKCSVEGKVAVLFPQRSLLTTIENGVRTQVELGFAPGRLLELLVSKADVIVGREEILEFAWPDRVVTQNSLNQAISKLRELLCDEQAKQIIQTIPRRGYLFNKSFLATPEEISSWDLPDDESGFAIPEAAPDTISAINGPGKKRHRLTLVLLGLSMAMAVSIFWRIDWTLLLKTDLSIETLQSGSHHLVYTAPDRVKLATLESEVTPIRERMVKLAEHSETLIFNRSNEYFDIVCMNEGGVKFLSIHASQILNIGDQYLRECLR